MAFTSSSLYVLFFLFRIFLHSSIVIFIAHLVLLSAAAVILLRFCRLASCSCAEDCQSAVGYTQTYISCFYGDIGASFRLMFKVNILLSFQFLQQKRKIVYRKGPPVRSPLKFCDLLSVFRLKCGPIETCNIECISFNPIGCGYLYLADF